MTSDGGLVAETANATQRLWLSGGVRRPRSDRQLIEHMRRGDQGAAEDLVRRYLPGAYRIAFAVTGNRETAEDVVQDSFERALRSLDDFDASRPFGPWLHRITSNRAIDVARSERVSLPLDETRMAAEDRFAAGDSARAVFAAMLTLPVDRRAVVVLRLVLGYTPDEVAEILGVEVGTVHSRLSRGLSALREELGGPDGL